ncbi:enoyl-CoA hydratase/isomerase family protein [Arthrobacter cryoconiti]|uniref:Enoyl-CoA hydratase/isomerase family protein n=1 Tax=Arthrobacter cryoconiti TaxID=748907 RepID=A0ABV8R3M6_9MICC|nr:enoyl-CoA hydratase/isomerase family protein [Arthrobacter cryoconiti]MCC9066790.1 enoyl-CoA hydratase/isomerase family protein [Arthrobacter cryoconiti]
MSTSATSTPARAGLLRVEQHGPVATLVMDNPTMRNALTQAMWQQFAAVLDKLDSDDSVKVVVVRGEGAHFSAGADIATVERILHDPATGQHDGGDITVAETALATFRKPTIAAIDGYCVGGGWQIAGACDIRLASENAVFGITPAKIGIVYPLSGIRRLVQLAGPATAKYLLFTGDFVNAQEAVQLGLAAKIMEASSLWEDVHAFALNLAGRSQFSVQSQKDLVNAISEGIPEDALANLNVFWQQEMAASDDPRIGVAAFLAKETPQFTWLRPST